MVQPSESTGDFETVVRAELRSLQQAYVNVLASIGAPRRAEEIARTLGLADELAHRMRRFADAIDPTTECAATLTVAEADAVAQRLVEVFGADSGADTLLRETRSFDALIEHFADDRSQFESMVTAFAHTARGSLLVESRRSVFRGSALALGTLRRATLAIKAFGPSSEPGRLAFAGINCGIGHQLIRRGAPTQLAAHLFTKGEDAQDEYGPWASLDAAALERFGVPILPEFSSPGLEGRVRREDQGNQTLMHLVDDAIGAPGAIDFALAFAYPSTEIPPEEFVSVCRIQTPSRMHVQELILHRDTPFEAPELRVFGTTVQTGWPAERDGPGTVPTEVDVEEFGADAPSPPLGEWNHYRALVASVAQRMGWRVEDLRRFRLTLPYPLTGSKTLLRSLVRGQG